jgi:hypothetical protein
MSRSGRNTPNISAQDYILLYFLVTVSEDYLY